MIHKNISIFRVLLDIGVIVFCWLVSYGIRFYFIPGAETGLELVFLKLTPLLVVLTLYNFYRNDVYCLGAKQLPYREILQTLKGNLLTIFWFVFLLYFFEESRISRLTIGIYCVLSSIVWILVRVISFKIERKIKNALQVLLVGNGSPLQKYIDTVSNCRYIKADIVGHVEPGNLFRENIKTFLDYESACKEVKPDVVLLSYEKEKSQKNMEFLAKYYNDVTPIKFLPNLSHSLIGYRIEDFEGIPMLDFNAPSFNTLDIALKRLLDIVGSFVGLVLLAPLFVIMGILVKCSSKGPIFYGQLRVGYGGKLFTMWKFRTMRMSRGEEEEKEWSNKDNPRKTFVGRLFRATSLDELPQLWNVLRGEMGLIGPRPEQPHFVEQFKKDIPGYMLRHKVRPGISGWAQVNGWRGDTDIVRRIECDIFYIKNWSLWLDFKIIVFTFLKGFINKNAY